jgi:hypothetical protein
MSDDTVFDEDKRDDSFFEDLPAEKDPWRGMGFVPLGPLFPSESQQSLSKPSLQTPRTRAAGLIRTDPEKRDPTPLALQPGRGSLGLG